MMPSDDVQIDTKLSGKAQNECRPSGVQRVFVRCQWKTEAGLVRFFVLTSRPFSQTDHRVMNNLAQKLKNKSSHLLLEEMFRKNATAEKLSRIYSASLPACGRLTKNHQQLGSAVWVTNAKA